MEETEPLSFMFMITGTPGVMGKDRWQLNIIEKGVPKELALAFLRHYLRNEENKYHGFFKDEYLKLL